MSKLLPCPFCGMPPKYHHSRNSLHSITCPQLGCVIVEVAEDTKAEAVKRWNRRTKSQTGGCGGER